MDEFAPIAPARSPADELLARPDEQRLREHQYRCAQAIIFGLPVLGLEAFGRSLGGAEAALWVGILQAVLAGWVLYVGATGMLVEGLLLLGRKLTTDLLVALAALVLYLLSVVAVVPLLFAREPRWSPHFHWVILLIAAWTGWRWFRLRRRLRSAA